MIADEISERCLAVRRAHPTWGPVKVRAWLRSRARCDDGGGEHDRGIVRSRGTDSKAELRRRSPPSSAPFAECTAANDVWLHRLQGWFLTATAITVSR